MYYTQKVFCWIDAGSIVVYPLPYKVKLFKLASKAWCYLSTYAWLCMLKTAKSISRICHNNLYDLVSFLTSYLRPPLTISHYLFMMYTLVDVITSNRPMWVDNWVEVGRKVDDIQIKCKATMENRHVSPLTMLCYKYTTALMNLYNLC